MISTELQKIIEEDHPLLDIDKKGIYRIHGRIKGERGGAFFGFCEDGTPAFGGANLIHAPTWWNHSFREVAEICDKIIARFPNCEAMPDKCN